MPIRRSRDSCIAAMGQPGLFATAEEAAWPSRASRPEGVAAALAAAAPEPVPMSRQGARGGGGGGASLVRAENTTGFGRRTAARPISRSRRSAQRPSGPFATAEEAALAVARYLGPEGVAAARVQARAESLAEVRAAAEAEGLSRCALTTPVASRACGPRGATSVSGRSDAGGRLSNWALATAEEAAAMRASSGPRAWRRHWRRLWSLR